MSVTQTHTHTSRRTWWRTFCSASSISSASGKVSGNPSECPTCIYYKYNNHNENTQHPYPFPLLQPIVCQNQLLTAHQLSYDTCCFQNQQRELIVLKRCIHLSYGGGGSFLACKDFGRMFDNSIPVCAFFFFFKVEISSRMLISLFRPESVHSGSASWNDWDWVFPDELCLGSFHDEFPHYAWTAA